MNEYAITIFNIEDIKKPSIMEEITVTADTKVEALDLAHMHAQTSYPNINKMLDCTKKISNRI